MASCLYQLSCENILIAYEYFQQLVGLHHIKDVHIIVTKVHAKSLYFTDPCPFPPFFPFSSHLPLFLLPLHSLNSFILPSSASRPPSRTSNSVKFEIGKKKIFWILNVGLKWVLTHFMQTLKDVTFYYIFYDRIVMIVTIKLLVLATDATYFTATNFKPYRCS